MNHSESSRDCHMRQNKVSRDDSKGKEPQKKVYVHRNSMFTEMQKINHIQNIQNICYVAFFFFMVCTVLYYVADPSKLWEDLDFLKWGLSPLPSFLMFWLLYNAFAFAFYEGFKLWIDVRTKIQSKIVDKFFLLLFVSSYCLTLAITGYYMIRAELHPILGFPLSTEQLRIHMKIYSFVRECAPRVLQHKPEKDGSQNHALYPTRKHYCYFLYVPVFLYRDSYPRSEERQWKNIFYHAFQFVLCVIFYCCLILRYRELFVNVGIQPFTLKQKVIAVAASLIPGLVTVFLLWYVVLHTWLNLFAEILRFGDREFYLDWWNSTTWGQHHRRWNIVVHDWLYTYCYLEFKKFKYTDDLCRTFVFLISGFFHEYQLCVAFGFSYPIFSIMYTSTGIIGVPATRGKKNQFFNIIIWICICLNMQIVAYHYAIEWYARINCPKNETFIDFFYPRILDPSCEVTIKSDRFNFYKFLNFEL